MFSVRLVSADSYQASPLTPYDVAFSEFRKSKIKNVPTIRVFGSTLSGKKVCLHIHGVFPYMYVPYVGGDSAEAFAHRLAEGLDSAINASLGSASAAAQHVYKIQEVKGVPFYGFHEKRHHFFKIYFYNPAIIKKAADLLQNGSVLSQTLQPHEAHIPFILQFMIDYNIYGMSLINLNDVKYRQINRRREYVRLNDENITPHFVTRNYLPPTVKRQSTCEIEVDAWASDIKNKDAIEKGLDVNPGLAAIWAEEKARRILDGFDGGDSQLGPSCSPPRSNLQPTDNDLLQIQRFQRKLVIISQSEETSVSMNSNSSYPVEVDDEFNLLDASHLERHIGPQYENQKQSNDKDKREQTKLYSDLVTLSRENLSLHLENERLENVHEEKSTVSKFEALQSSGKESCSQNQNGTLNKSIFEAEDISLVDILENLAEGHETNELVEEDSILGSHCSAVVSEYKSDEEDQDGISDLNLTTFEIDSLSLNCASTVCSGRPESAASDREKGATSFAIKSLSVEDSDDQNTIHSQSGSKNSSMIPQFDGTDDLPRKRSSSVERSALKKSRKAGNGNKDVLVKVEGNLNRVKGREKIYQSQVKGSNDYSELDNAKKEEFKIFDSSTSGTLESDLDRTLVPEGKEVVAFEGKSLISESSESADVSEYAGPDHTLMVVEKLICDYKSSKEVVRSARKEMIVNHKDYGIERRSIFLKDEERQLQSSSRVLKSPKRDLSSSTCDLMSPSRTLKCPSSSKQTPNKESRSSSRALKGPSYALRSPRRNYETLNITVTPSKKRKEFDKKLDGISKDDESSGDASLKEISVFTKKSTSKDEVFNVKSNRKPLLPDKETLVKSSEDVCACVSPNRKLVFSQKSETEESCKDVETPKKLLLSTKPQSRKHYKDVFWESVALDRKCMLSQKSRLGKSSEADEIYGKQLLSQKSQSSKSSKDDCSVNASTNRRIVFSQISQFKKCSEDKFSKVTKSKERLLSSQKSTVAKSLECDNFIKGIVHEILLTQKTALEKHSEDELNFLSYGKSSKTNSSESNLLEDINNISPQLEKNKVYDEETDSSDFEGNLEVFRKGLSSDSKSIKILPESGKLMKEMIEEEEHLGREKNPESGKMKVLDVNITEEINNQVCNTEDLLTVTFTEFANIHLNPRYKFTTKSILNLNLNPLVAITTKNFAPTRQNVVQNMHLYGIPTCRNQEPFYSDHNDIRAQKDITHQIINKKQVLDYPPFKSEIGSVVGIKLWRRMKVNEFQSSGAKLNSVDIKKGLAERRLRTITPLYLPPNTKKVVKWLKAKGHLKCKEEEKVQETKECVEKNKHGVENKSESSNLEDKAKLNSFVSSSVLEVSVNSEEKSRESLSKDSFLCSTLGPSELLISEKNKKKLGRVSFGQVDFSMDETKTQDDVANQNLQNAKAITTYQFLTILSLEVHVATRKDLLPDPQYDPIEALFYVIYNDFPPTSTVKRVQLGAIIVDLNESHNLRGLYPSCAITYATCEEDLFCNIVSLIGECNPDILIGWELETLSWGYVLQRAAHLGANLATSISRIPGSKCAWESQALDLEDLAEIKLPGRIVLDVWRIMRHEIALLSYTFENVMFHVMHQRLPCPSFKTLTEWWNSEVPCLRWRVLDFYTKKVLGILKLLDQLDIIETQ